MSRKPTVADLTIKWKPTPAMVTAYSKTITRFVSAVDSVADEQKGELHELLWVTVMKGFDMAKLTEDLVGRFHLDWREAAAISRHQCSAAKQVMENARRLEFGLTESIWMHPGIPCEDAPHHEVLNGKRYKTESGVLVDGKQIWPGTERGCKCVSRAVIHGFED